MITKTTAFNFLRKCFFQNSFAELRLRKLTAGKTNGHWVSRLVPNHYQYPSPSLRPVVKNGHRMDFDLSDMMEWYAFFGFADPSLENLLQLAEEGNRVLDVGANIGSTMTALSKQVGQTGQILGFEPDPTIFLKCQQNLLLNQATNADLFPLALGEEPKDAFLRIRSHSNRGMNQVVPKNLTTTESVSISLTTMDEFVESKKLNSIDLIKIDVEGYEWNVLRGGQATIKRFRPKMFIEIDDSNLSDQGATPMQIVEFFKKLHYDLYWEKLSQPLKENWLTDCHFDLVAIPKELGRLHEESGLVRSSSQL